MRYSAMYFAESVRIKKKLSPSKLFIAPFQPNLISKPSTAGLGKIIGLFTRKQPASPGKNSSGWPNGASTASNFARKSCIYKINILYIYVNY